MFRLSFTVHKSILINAQPQTVFTTLMDFKNWPRWSPWICQEPECPIEIHGKAGAVGHSQSWNGQRIGSGHMTITQTSKDRSLEYELAFLKPWKSRSHVSFHLEPQGEQTLVHWKMDGSLPIFLFFMKKSMSAWVGHDYTRGLSMLKDLVETGSVASFTDFHGLTKEAGFYSYGLRRTCNTSELGELMTKDFTALMSLIEQHKMPTPEHYLSIYHTYDLVTQTCDYVAAVGYTTAPATAPAELETLEFTEHQVLSATHTGAYKHLGNLWSTLMICQQQQKLKTSRHLPMYEIYLNTPDTCEEKDLKTQGYLPVQ